MWVYIRSALGLVALAFLACAGWFLSAASPAGAGVGLLAFFCSLALVGPGNRVIWCTVFALLSMAMFALLAWVLTHLPEQGRLLGGVLLYGLLPLSPAVFLWVAHRLRLRRSKGGRHAVTWHPVAVESKL